MDRYPIEDAGWETILNLAFDRSVLQLGYGDGYDSVRLARAAHHLTVMGTPIDCEWDREKVRLENLRNVAWHCGVYKHLTICRAPWKDALDVHAPQQWDLAILDPATLGWDLLETFLVPALNWASHLILVEPPNWDSWDAVTRLCPAGHFSVTKSGRLIIANRTFGEDSADGSAD